jgi:hypothetical protein
MPAVKAGQNGAVRPQRSFNKGLPLAVLRTCACAAPSCRASSWQMLRSRQLIGRCGKVNRAGLSFVPALRRTRSDLAGCVNGPQGSLLHHVHSS